MDIKIWLTFSWSSLICFFIFSWHNIFTVKKSNEKLWSFWMSKEGFSFFSFSERTIIILEYLNAFKQYVPTTAFKQYAPTTCKLKSFISGKFA